LIEKEKKREFAEKEKETQNAKRWYARSDGPFTCTLICGGQVQCWLRSPFGQHRV